MAFSVNPGDGDFLIRAWLSPDQRCDRARRDGRNGSGYVWLASAALRYKRRVAPASTDRNW